MKRPRVVVVGAGFAGLQAAKRLGKRPVDLIVIDKRNHHLFQPLLYQVATAALNPADIASPIRRVLRRQANTEVILGEVEEVDLKGRAVKVDGEKLSYDYLVLAAGATSSYFGNERWEPDAPSLKTLSDALEVRHRILIAFENAESEDDERARQAWLTFAIIGGGPTGVELAGAIGEISRHTLAADFRWIDPRDARVILVEAKDRLLPTFGSGLGLKAQQRLEKLGVEVLINTSVVEIATNFVRIVSHDGVETQIEAKTSIWAAGIQASPLGKALGIETDRSGRVKVSQDLSIPGHPEVFVIGDLAVSIDDPLPAVAPVAMQQGRHVAGNIARNLRGLPSTPFAYREKGMLAAIGRASAVAELKHMTMSGWTAWILWLFVHIYYLIGFRNRVIVMLQWAWAYVTHERGARLITGEHRGRSGR